MTHNRAIRLAEILVFVVIFVAGFGAAVWQLWNLLMPQIFGLPRIGYWQSLGLLALSWLLFGGFRGPFGSRRPKTWERMSPEQRAQLRHAFQSHCGRTGAPAEASKG